MSLLSEALKAINEEDYEALESLRDEDVTTILPQLIEEFYKTDNWDVRDAIVFLVQDLYDEELTEIYEMALDSPLVDTQIIALCFLKDDYTLFEKLYDDDEKLEKAVKQYKKSMM